MYYLGKRYLKDHLKGEGGDLPGGGGGGVTGTIWYFSFLQVIKKKVSVVSEYWQRTGF